MRKWFPSLLVALALAGVTAAAQAQPSLKMMIPANPGGGWDQTGRNLATAMQSAKLVSSVQFDNKGGAGGTIGLAQFVSSSKGDPNAVMIGGLVMVGGIILGKSPVNLSMVTPLARLTGEYEIIVVPSNSPHKTMADLVKAFKANPGSISWGGGSAGGTDHILAGLVAKAAGADVAKLNYVPFSGGGEALAAVMGGHVVAGISGYGEWAGQIKSGELRALAISSPERQPGIDIATLKEQGVDVDLANWRAIVAPPGLDDAQKNALLEAVDAAVKSDAWKKVLTEKNWTDLYLSGDDFGKLIAAENVRTTEILKGIGLVQ